jgi:hypothetical protein
VFLFEVSRTVYARPNGAVRNTATITKSLAFFNTIIIEVSFFPAVPTFGV